VTTTLQHYDYLVALQQTTMLQLTTMLMQATVVLQLDYLPL